MMEHGLTNRIAEVLQGCIDGGWRLPYYVAAVSSNGSAMFFRYVPCDEGLKASVLASHVEGPGLVAPINMMVTDAAGEAARVLMRNPGTGDEPVH